MQQQRDAESVDGDLPPNWTSRIDSRYNRRYYYNKVTKQSSWTKPQPEGSSNGSPTDARTGPREMGSRRASKEGESIVDENGDKWVPVYSKNYQRYYYYNKESGETTWSQPRPSSTSTHTRPNARDHASNQTNGTNRKPSSIGKTGLSNETGNSSDDEVGSAPKHDVEDGDYDPELFQKKMMQQFPALKKAFLELEEGRRRLQQEREEHEAKMRRELEMVNAKLEELKNLSNKLNPISSAQTEGVPNQNVPADGTAAQTRRQSVTSVRPRKLTLEQDLRRYSMDLERRSVSVVEKRKSMRTASGVPAEDLRSVVEEANRLAAERGNAPATAESAAAQMSRISAQFSGTLSINSAENGDNPLQEIADEMDGVQKGLDYAMKEAEAQNEAAEEAQTAGDDNEYYTLLEVGSGATDAELKKAYRRKLIEWHPDKVKSEKREQAMKMTDMIQNAYRVLSDPWERDIYDWFGFQQYLLHVKVLECFKNYLVAGIELVKHPRKGRPRKRVVWLDKDLTEILSFRKRVMEDQRNGKEKIKGVSIKSVTNVTTGRATDVLKRTGRSSHNDRYFSLICSDRTLDFECPSEESCNFIATRMKLLIIDLKRDREWMHRHYDELEQGG